MRNKHIFYWNIHWNVSIYYCFLLIFGTKYKSMSNKPVTHLNMALDQLNLCLLSNITNT